MNVPSTLVELDGITLSELVSAVVQSIFCLLKVLDPANGLLVAWLVAIAK